MSETMDVLNRALKLEQEGQAFYLQAAQRTLDARGAAMFRSLADDEQKHAAMIQRQIDALHRGEGWLPPESVAEPIDLDTPLFPRGAEALEKAVPTNTNELEALAFALKIENDSFDLYSHTAKTSEDPAAKQMYMYLAAAERTHFNLLMSNYESIASLGGWVS